MFGKTRHFLLGATILWSTSVVTAQTIPRSPDPDVHKEQPTNLYLPGPGTPPTNYVHRTGPVIRNGYISVQVNVDAQGENIPGDAANEPSIAIDPTDPDRIVIGWRQFDNISSNFRQAGWGYSHDRGQTWTFRTGFAITSRVRFSPPVSGPGCA